ncbi:TPA: hypothetical protein ACGUPM_002682 [Vibrio vulnificus]
MERLSLQQIINLANQLHSYSIHKQDLSQFVAQLDKSDPIFDDISTSVHDLEDLSQNLEVQVSPEVFAKVKSVLALSDQLGDKLNTTMAGAIY